MAEPEIELLADAWEALSRLGHELRDDEWLLPTDCPGWSVQDNLAHVIGLERMLQGHPVPEAVASPGSHVHNDLGRVNEAWVAAMRPLSGAEALEQFDIVASERLAELAALSTDAWDAPADTPAGRDTYRGFMRLRAFDSWVHEQDIRRATRRPGHLTGPAAEHSVDHLGRMLPFIVAKRAAAPDGSVVTWTLTGPVERRFAAVVDAGRGSLHLHDDRAPTAAITSDTETFVCLVCGRWAAQRAHHEGRLTVAGDEALANRVLASAGVMI